MSETRKEEKYVLEQVSKEIRILMGLSLAGSEPKLDAFDVSTSRPDLHQSTERPVIGRNIFKDGIPL